MIVEMRTYTIQPGSTPEYFKVYETMGMEAQKEILGHMVGYYATEIGELNQVVHMWAYDSLDSRTCLLYTSPSPRDQRGSRMAASA